MTEGPTVIHRKTSLTVEELADAVIHWLNRERGWVGGAQNVRMHLTETAAGKQVLLVEFDHTPAKGDG